MNSTSAPAPQPPDAPRKPVSGAVGGVLALTVALAVAAAWWFAPGWNWIAAMLAMCVFLGALGYALNGRVLGVLINERKLMSLSRLQMIVWTLLIVSAYLVIAIVRVKADVANPLVVTIDWQVWALLGISTTALVGTPFLNSVKKQKEPGRTPEEREKLVEKVAEGFVGETVDDVNENRDGLLYGNRSVKDARLTDLFEGDEIGNTRFIDMGQVQMFFFSVIVAVVYGVELFQMISSGKLLAGDLGLPLLPEGLLALMGVSNAGYLGNKAITRTPTDS